MKTYWKHVLLAISVVVVLAMIFLGGCSYAHTGQSYSMKDIGPGVQGGFEQGPSLRATRNWTIRRGPTTQPVVRSARYRVSVVDGQYILIPIEN